MNCHRLLNLVGRGMIAVGVLGFVGSIVVPQSLASKAELVQRVQPYDADTAALTGEAGTLIGSPQLMVISDEKAFMQGSSPEGARLVDDEYLKKNDIYPLQAKTINYVGDLLRLAFGAAAMMGVAMLLLKRRFASCPVPISPTVPTN